MDSTAMWGFILIGAGAVVAGMLGLALPARERLAALLALVIGAGVGVAALAIGTHNTTSPDDATLAFLIASALGFLSVVVSSAGIWVRLGNPKPPPPPTDSNTP
jgi:peptidoglycan/LPS O-acetylase OafA/YrhL